LPDVRGETVPHELINKISLARELHAAESRPLLKDASEQSVFASRISARMPIFVMLAEASMTRKLEAMVGKCLRWMRRRTPGALSGRLELREIETVGDRLTSLEGQQGASSSIRGAEAPEIFAISVPAPKQEQESPVFFWTMLSVIGFAEKTPEGGRREPPQNRGRRGRLQ